MTSTNGSEPVSAKGSGSNDPAVLAAEIEKTREDLAETLDAIAEKVSPKRVAGRTKKKVADAVTSAKETVVEQAGAARDKVAESAGAAKDKLSEATSSGTPVTTGGSTRIDTPTAPVDVSASVPPLPPVTAVSAEGLDLSPSSTTVPVVSPTPTSTFPTAPAVPYTAPGPLVRKEYAAGAGLGVLVLLLLRRRRTRRRALRPVAKSRRRR
ncbi:MAG: hypothetical protein JWM64_2171 [Frankiales bacterium]|nr:hypothetical protein [Frankiales bacterium]